MMSYKQLIVVMVLAFGIAGGCWAEGKKKVADSVRITELEMQVDILAKDLTAAHMWASGVNEDIDTCDKRTQDLNRRLTAVENRGPVAQR